MNRIHAAFASPSTGPARVVIPFVCGGHPTPGVTTRSLLALSDLGCPVIEVGIPFSDPIADGPVIAAAMHEVLNPPAGVPIATPARVFDEIRAARAGCRAAIVAMVSCSIVFRVGTARFVSMARDAGVDGVIFPDLLLEESQELRRMCAEAGLGVTMLIAPTTPAPRAAELARACTGFVYLLARTGITGQSPGPAAHANSNAGVPASASLGERVRALRSVTKLPIACGFGISTKEHVAAVAREADAAIVGSALVKAMGDAHAAGRDPAHAAAGFVRTLV